MLPFTYAVARSAEEAVDLLRTGGVGTRYLGGGTTLYDLMKLDVERPSAVVDVTRIRGGEQISLTGGEIVLGAGARMADVAAHPRLRAEYPVLTESLDLAASQQLRTMATVGGNLLQRTRCAYFRGGPVYPCNKREPGSGCSAIGGADRPMALLGTSASCIAVYPGDWAIALVALDAVIDVLGPDGARTVPVAELIVEPGDRPEVEHALAPAELITRIRVPRTPTGRGSTYLKIRDRESYAFAIASAAVALDLRDGVVIDARVAVGGVATVPWRVPAAEAALVGGRPTPDAARRAGELALAGARPGRENGFRVELAVRTVADAVAIAAGRAA